MYTTTALILGLPTARQARRIRAQESSKCYYLPGLNDWVFQKVAERGSTNPLQNGMDGTPIYYPHNRKKWQRGSIIELYRDQYLVGKEFPPDIFLWPSPTDLLQPTTMQGVHGYILQVRCDHSLAAEAYSFNHNWGVCCHTVLIFLQKCLRSKNMQQDITTL